MTKPKSTTDRRVTTSEAMIRDLDGTTLRVLLCLAGHADFGLGTNARPAIDTIANDLNLSRPTVKRALEIGIEKNYLTKEVQKRSDGLNEPSVYNCLWIKRLMDEQTKKPNDLYRVTHEPRGRVTHDPQPSTLNLRRRVTAATLINQWNSYNPNRRAQLPLKTPAIIFARDWASVDPAWLAEHLRAYATSKSTLLKVLVAIWEKHQADTF